VARTKPSKDSRRRRRTARTPEDREDQLVSLAADLAEEQIENGTASSQVITHFLKLGSSRERLEQERIRHENDLMEVKRQQIEGQKRVEELYMAALDAMRSYSGSMPDPEPDDD
jgi:hypothetical protein